MSAIKDQVVIITGASAGIGKAIAQAFAQEGAKLVLAARREAVLQQVKDELEPFNVPVLVVPTDVTRDDDLDNLVQRTLDEFGQIDILVNNAGIGCGGAFTEIDTGCLHRMVHVNLTSVIYLTQTVLKVMLEQQRGHIVNMSSTSGIVAAPGLHIYGATKSALNAFSDGLRRELRGAPIQLSLLIPGYADTDMIGHMDKQAMSRAGIVTPFIHFIDPQDIADQVIRMVRHNRREVVMGGLQFYASALITRWISVPLIDLYFRLFSDVKLLQQVFKNFG